MSKDHEEKVGYKKPPTKTQFKKGKSGNPKGRPKKDRNLHFANTCISSLNELIEITEGGVRKKISKKEAYLKAVLNKSLSGNTASSKIILDVLHKIVIPYEQKNISDAENYEDRPPVVFIVDDIINRPDNED